MKRSTFVPINLTIEVTLSKHAAHFASSNDTQNNPSKTITNLKTTQASSDSAVCTDLKTITSSEVNGSAQQDMHKKGTQTHKHLGRRIALAVFVLLILGYVGAGIYFTNHLMYRTTLNGQDVSYMDTNTLATYLDKQLSTYTIHVSGLNFDMTLDQSQLNLNVDTQSCAEDVLKHNAAGFTWVQYVFQPQHINMQQQPSFDEDSVQSLITEQVNAFNTNATNPVNAYSQYDSSAQSFTIKDAQVGSALEAKAVSDCVIHDIYELRSESLLDDSVLKQPTLTAQDPDLIAINNKANKALELSIALMYNQQQVATVDKTLLAQWMHVADPKTLSIDQSAVETWGKDNLHIKSNDSGVITKINYDKLNELLTQAVCNLDVHEIILPVKVLHTTPKGAPAETPGARELGRHIDVNLATQYARLYDESGDILWESWFVSGGNSDDHATPTGTFEIRAKARNQTLIGADTDKDGEPDYKSHVDYWMPFVGNMVGLHDAPWRSSFGGSIYKTNGSHGCVNLPPSKAAELFSLVHVGDSVVVHW